MAYNSKILLGKIVKLSGYEGAVTVKLERIFSENIPEMESVFVEIDGRPVPFFIQYTEYSGADIIKFKFTGYNSSEKMSDFIGCKVFMTSVLSMESHGEDFQEIIGFDLFDQTRSLLGKVTEVLSNPGQILLKITSKDKREFLIPLHEDLIISFDRKKKTLVMNIPEGLTEIN